MVLSLFSPLTIPTWELDNPVADFIANEVWEDSQLV